MLHKISCEIYVTLWGNLRVGPDTKQSNLFCTKTRLSCYSFLRVVVSSDIYSSEQS